MMEMKIVKTESVDDKVLHYYATKVVERTMKQQKALSIIEKMAKGKADVIASHVRSDIRNRFTDAINSMQRVRRLNQLAKRLN